MTYRDLTQRLLLSFILLAWAILFVALAFESGANSLMTLLYVNYGVPAGVTSFLCFGTGAVLAWSGLTALFSKNWQDERFETVALSFSAALGVAIGFAALTPQSEFWQFIAQIAIFISLVFSVITAGLLLALSTLPVARAKPIAVSNDNDIGYQRRASSSAFEVATFQTLKERWPQ